VTPRSRPPLQSSQLRNVQRGRAALLTVLEALFNAFGRSLNDWLDRKRAAETSQDLGRVTAERDQETATRATTERELGAAIDAPQTTDEAIRRLEEGSA
jgi:hypothetical protein